VFGFAATKTVPERAKTYPGPSAFVSGCHEWAALLYCCWCVLPVHMMYCFCAATVYCQYSCVLLQYCFSTATGYSIVLSSSGGCMCHWVCCTICWIHIGALSAVRQNLSTVPALGLRPVELAVL
jgi:hypothetical protein